MFDPISFIILQALQLYFYAVMIWTIMSVLISFNIINPYQPVVAKIFGFLEKLVEPALQPIRKILPPIGGMDLSPLVLILGIQFAERCIVYVATAIALH